MAVVIQYRYSEAIHPLHAVLVSGALALFIGALLSDIAYAKTYEIQWGNFASWLIVALLDLLRAHRRVPGIGIYFLLLLATWVAAFINALYHARDAWAMMPGGLILSVVTTLLACLTTWVGFRTPQFVGREA
jgi:uncharacterized membrane protein